jgi:hypothetical protein
MIKKFIMSLLFGEPHEMARIKMDTKSKVFCIYPDERFNNRYLLSATGYMVNNNYGSSMHCFNTWVVEVEVSPEFPLRIAPAGLVSEEEPKVSSFLLHGIDTQVALEKAEFMMKALRDRFGAPDRFTINESAPVPQT